MKEQLRRELSKTYLILSSEDEGYEESYEIEMIQKNNLKMILPLRVLRMNGIINLYYDVSSKQTLKDCAERAKLSADTIRKLFEAIHFLISEVEEYLLDLEGVFLDLEHIYTKEGMFYFCYCPWKREDSLLSFRSMLEEILGNLDYHDTKGVELAYHLYQSACKGDFDISKILEEHAEKEKIEFPVEKNEEFISTDFETEIQWGEEKEEKEAEMKEKNLGLLARILKFFLKKQEVPDDSNRLDTLEEEHYQMSFSEKSLQAGYTEVLETSCKNTILLEDMPMGRWKLRPLLPEYEEFLVCGESFLVGKKRDSVDGFIGRDTISRIHSRLCVRDEHLYISDANSTNGTFVNGVAIEPGKEVEIYPGDRILFADVGYECYNSL